MTHLSHASILLLDMFWVSFLQSGCVRNIASRYMHCDSTESVGVKRFRILPNGPQVAPGRASYVGAWRHRESRLLPSALNFAIGAYILPLLWCSTGLPSRCVPQWSRCPPAATMPHETIYHPRVEQAVAVTSSIPGCGARFPVRGYLVGQPDVSRSLVHCMLCFVCP